MAPSNVEPGLLALLTKHCSQLGTRFTPARSPNVVTASSDDDSISKSLLFAKSVPLSSSSKRQVDQILGEAASLDALHQASLAAGHGHQSLIPTLHAYGSDEESNAAFLITDYRNLTSGLSSSAQSKLGTKLAQMHLNGTSKDGRFGFHRPTHCGVTEQDNTWETSWPTFWTERRIGDLVRRLQDPEISALEKEMREKVYPLIFRAFEHVKEPIRPAIIHGDLWSGNAGVDSHTGEPVIFDPSSYYAHNEAELGIMRMFRGFSSPFYDAYHKVIPKLEPYHEERVQNYELYHHLNHVLMFGGSYRSGAKRIMERLISWAQIESGKGQGVDKLSRQSGEGQDEIAPRRIHSRIVNEEQNETARKGSDSPSPFGRRQGPKRRGSDKASFLRLLPSLLGFLSLFIVFPSLITASSSSTTRSTTNEGFHERFDERLTMRPLQDGRLQALFEFHIQSDLSPFPPSPSASGGRKGEGATHSHFSMLPRPLLQAARLGGAKEIFLAMNSGRWDFAKWGSPTFSGPEEKEEEVVVVDGGKEKKMGKRKRRRRGEWNVGSGAEVWARLRGEEDGGEEILVGGGDGGQKGRVSSLGGLLNGTESMSASELPRGSMTKWRRLMASLAGLFCASLDGIDERLTTSPRLAYSSSSSSASSASKTHLLHAFLPSEQICTENLTPFLKLLPCKSSAGLASLLEPHKLFAADFHGMTVRLRQKDGAREGWEMHLTFQAVFSPAVGVWAFKRDWSLQKLFDRKLRTSCPLATSSKVHVLRPQDDEAPSETECSGWPKPRYVVTPIQEEHVERLEKAERERYGYEEEDEDDEMRLERATRRPFRTAEVVKRDGQVTYDVGKLGSGEYGDALDVEMRWVEEVDYAYPPRYVRPPLTATRQLIGAGQESGTLRLVLRNDDKLRERKVLYFEVLPWFIQPSLHSLEVKATADEFDEESDHLVRYTDDLTSPLLLNLTYTPSIARIRPFLLEAQLRIPASSTVELTMSYDKAFLRYTEHPPDAHRGFDVPPATVWMLDEAGTKDATAAATASAIGTEDVEDDNETPRSYTAPALVELAVPDFSMPYNVIIFTSTIVALCLGSALNNLVRTYKDVVVVVPPA